jgi:hypothetical protein
MAKHDPKRVEKLSQRMSIEPQFLHACIEASIIEIRENSGDLDFENGTAIELRRLERVCLTFAVDIHVALLITHARQRPKSFDL